LPEGHLKAPWCTCYPYSRCAKSPAYRYGWDTMLCRRYFLFTVNDFI